MRQKLIGKCRYDENKFEVFLKKPWKLVIKFEDDRYLVFNLRHRNNYAIDEFRHPIDGLSVSVEHMGQMEPLPPGNDSNGQVIWSVTEMNFGTIRYLGRSE